MIRFYRLISSCILFPMIVACQNSKEVRDDRSDTIPSKNPKIVQQHQTEHQHPSITNPKKLPDGYLPNDISRLEEIPTIQKYLSLEKLVAEVESDIPNKRIILFKNNDTNAFVYKSIYIKNDQHLQIVDLVKDQVLYDGTLDR